MSKILRRLESMGIYLDVHHCRLYRGYNETDRLINDYCDTPRRISMEDLCDVMLTKDEANIQEISVKRLVPKGGQTNIAAYDEASGELLAEDCSICSLNDAYNKRIGIEIAGGRLYEKLRQTIHFNWEEVTTEDSPPQTEIARYALSNGENLP